MYLCFLFRVSFLKFNLVRGCDVSDFFRRIGISIGWFIVGLIFLLFC